MARNVHYFVGSITQCGCVTEQKCAHKNTSLLYRTLWQATMAVLYPAVLMFRMCEELFF